MRPALLPKSPRLLGPTGGGRYNGGLEHPAARAPTGAQGAWATGCCGNDGARTPDIDRLAPPEGAFYPLE